MRLVHRFLDSAGQRDMILFQKYRVIQSEAVVGAAARLHRIFFQCPQTRCRFPGIPNPRSRPCQLFHETPCQRRDSAKMRQKIQRGSLAGEDCTGISLDLHDFRARFDKRPIVVRAGNSDLRIQRAEDLFGYRQSRANECLPGEDVSTRRRARWYHRRGRSVSRTDILFQRAAHKVSNVTRIPIHRAPRNYEAPSSCDNRSCDLRSSMRCSASVASSPLMIFSGARLRNVSSPSCLSLEAMAFCRPSISFLSRVFSLATSTVSEYAMRTSKVAVERTAPLFASNCWRGTIRSSDKTANLSIAPRFSRISAPAPASLVENSAATLFLGSSFSSARMLRSAVTTSWIAATSPIAFAFFQWSCASGN